MRMRSQLGTGEFGLASAHSEQEATPHTRAIWLHPFKPPVNHLPRLRLSVRYPHVRTISVRYPYDIRTTSTRNIHVHPTVTSTYIPIFGCTIPPPLLESEALLALSMHNGTGLGVAWEIRPAMLAATSTVERMEVATAGIEASIQSLRGATAR